MLYPLFREEKVANIAVFDAVATKVELIEGDYVLWKIVANSLIDTEFTLNSFLGSEQIAHLNVQYLILSMTDKVYFLCTCF